MNSALCCKCHKKPRGTSGYCTECNRVYQREYARRKRGAKPRKMPWRTLKAHEKYCPGCNRILDRNEFSNSSTKKDGKQSHCKRCASFKQMRYTSKNRLRLRPLRRISSAAFRAAHPGYNTNAVRRYRKRKLLRKIEEALYGAQYD